ncbi:MAG: hypothetical protein ACI8QF_004197, partial [Limisphaerales bacterium]
TPGTASVSVGERDAVLGVPFFKDLSRGLRRAA